MQVVRSRVRRVLLPVIAAYAVLWALTATLGTTAVRPQMIAGLAIDDTFRELPAPEQVYKTAGRVYALSFATYAPLLVTVHWVRSDENSASRETELFVWLGRAFHIYSFRKSGWGSEGPNHAMQRTANRPYA